MDTRVYCVYNVARGALLSSQVTVADGANQPLTILRVLVGGLAIDSKSGLWISPLHGLPAVPRLFPFDLVYLDEELRVLDLTEYVPGAEFPPYRREVTSALILPSQSLHSTQTGRDDRLLICPAEEMDRQIAVSGTGSPFPLRTSPSANQDPLRFPIPQFEPAPRAASDARFAASMKAGAAAAVAEEGLASASPARLGELGDGPSLRKKWPLTPAMTATDPSPEAAAAAPQSQTMEQPGLNNYQEKKTRSVLAAIGAEQVVETAPVAETAVMQEAAEVSSSSEAKIASQSDAPVISITEVILERPRGVEPPTIVGVHGEALYGDIDDLFSNWMDTPTLASTWKARSAEPARQPTKAPIAPIVAETPSTEASTPAASPHIGSDAVPSLSPVTQAEQVKSEVEVKPVAIVASMNQPERLPEPQADAASARTEKADDAEPVQVKPELSKAEAELQKIKVEPPKTESAQVATPPVSTSARVVLPQSTQASTSTVAHYGLWRTSLPTAVMPVAPATAPKEPAKEHASASVPSAPPEEVAKTATGTPKASGTAKAIASPQAADLPLSPTVTPGVEAAVKSPARPPVVKDAQPGPRKAPLDIAKPSFAKPAEAVSRRPHIPDNFLAADERHKPVNRIAPSAVPDKSAVEELVRPSTERTPDHLPSVPGDASAAEAVDIVQRKLGIGQANALANTLANTVDGTAGAEAEKAEAVPVPGRTSAEIVEPPKSVVATKPITGKEPALSSRSSLAPSDTEIVTQNQKLIVSAGPVEANGKSSAQARTLTERIKQWLNPESKANSDRRRAHRRYVPGMVAHYYTGGAPKPHDIADISMTGFYLLTEDRWMPDTMIQMTLQKPCAKGERKQSITVLSKIVRRGSDGVAAQFVMAESLDPHSHEVQPSQTTDRFALARFI